MKGTQQLKEQLLQLIPGRHDVYAVQHKTGYQPVYAPLSIDQYEDPNLTIGAYLVGEDAMVQFGAIDIDVRREYYLNAPISVFRDPLQKQTLQIVGVLEQAGIKYLIEDSGFKGYHILIFLANKISAAAMRLKLKELEKEFRLVDHRLAWELFPKQDRVEPGKFGNLFKFPLQKHQKSQRDSFFVDKKFNEITPDHIPLNSLNLIQVSKPAPALAPSKKKSPGSPGEFDLYKMEQGCEQIRAAIKTAKLDHHLKHDPRVNIAAVYKSFGSTGEERVHEIFSELSDYNQEKTQDHLDSLSGKPTRCKTFCGNYRCPAMQLLGKKTPAALANIAAGEIFEKGGRYLVKRFNRNGQRNDRVLTEWVIIPQKMVDLGSTDVMFCDIKSTQGKTFRDMRIENNAWLSRQKLLKALGHSELTFHGSDADVQNLAQYITGHTQIKKTGITHIGLEGDIFVAQGVNITNGGLFLDPEIELYIHGEESLGEEYQLARECTDANYLTVATAVFENLPKINEPGVIYPLIGWNALVPIKAKVKELIGGFPVANASGEQGSGKTATLEKIGQLNGHVDGTVHDCRITKFAMLHLVSSTNAVPIILDEYKESQMDRQQVTAIKDMLRGVYRGEVTKRGHADLSVSSYKYRAPVIISGEYKIDETAIRERSIFASFKKKSLMGGQYKTPFENLSGIELGLFQPRYIQYLLGLDLQAYLARARSYFATHTVFSKVAPRVQNNWLVTHMGLSVWYDYGVSLGLTPDVVPFDKIFEVQADELGYNAQGYMLRDVDRLLEHMATMAENEVVKHGKQYAIVDGVLLVHPSSMLAAARKYSQSHNLDLFIMDESSFRTQLKDANYFNGLDLKQVDGIQKRWAFLDMTKMKSAGFEIDGFNAQSS